MAETLGSLVDKLSIKNLRIWHLDEALENAETPASKREELQVKRDMADRQRQDLAKEIDSFLGAALRGEVRIRDEKIKMYTNTNVSSSDAIKELGIAVSELACRNIKLWHLEDEARRTDLPDAEIVQIKRKIDATNQERNDLMDKVDEILSRHSTTNHGRSTSAGNE
jgi:predicted HAD superfamily phosphohydrolase